MCSQNEINTKLIGFWYSSVFSFSSRYFFSPATKAEAQKGNNPPEINFVGLSGNTMKVGSNQYINVNFNFSDKNGDLGNTPSSGNFDIYTIDSRDTEMVNYFFPQELPDYIDPTQGVSGQCALGIQAAFLALRPNHPDGDTLSLEIYIKDKAGNESNRFTTPDIYLTP